MITLQTALEQTMSKLIHKVLQWTS